MKVPLADDKRDEWEPRVERGAVITVGGGGTEERMSFNTWASCHSWKATGWLMPFSLAFLRILRI